MAAITYPMICRIVLIVLFILVYRLLFTVYCYSNNFQFEERGLEHRSNRPIEPEAVFGQMKYNMHYKRFRHFGKDKVTMDFAFFAIAFNIKKNGNKSPKTGQYANKRKEIYASYILIYAILGLVWSHKAEIMKNAA